MDKNLPRSAAELGKEQAGGLKELEGGVNGGRTTQKTMLLGRKEANVK